MKLLFATLTCILCALYANGQARMHDIYGIVLDSSTREPLNNVSLLLKEENRKVLTDSTGRFVFSNVKQKATLQVIKEGYTYNEIAANTGHETIVMLQPLFVHMHELKIAAKAIDPTDIMSKVKQHFDGNYDNRLYAQEGFFNLKIYYFDSLVANADYIADLYVNREKKTHWLDFKQKRRNHYDENIMNRLGNTFMSIMQANRLDFIHDDGRVFGENDYKKYDYKLLRSVEDPTWGAVYIIEFVPQKLTRKYAYDYFSKRLTGQLKIRKKDYAIVSVQYESERETKKLAKWSEKYQDDKKQRWEAKPSRELYQFKADYTQDTTGKYQLVKAYFAHYEEGTFNDGGDEVKMYEELSFDHHGGRVLHDAMPGDTMKIYPSTISYNPDFWIAFDAARTK